MVLTMGLKVFMKTYFLNKKATEIGDQDYHLIYKLTN